MNMKCLVKATGKVRILEERLGLINNRFPDNNIKNTNLKHVWGKLRRVNWMVFFYCFTVILSIKNKQVIYKGNSKRLYSRLEYKLIRLINSRSSTISFTFINVIPDFRLGTRSSYSIF